MQLDQNLFSKRRNHLFAFIAMLLVAVTSLAFHMKDSEDFDVSRREVLLRKIGHELLLQSGDSKSRVLPIKKIEANEYQLEFENELAFLPEALVNTTRRLLSEDPLTSDYVVKVLKNGSVTYGYAIAKDKKEDIIACIGRVQPKAHYLINIKFKPTGINITNKGYLLGGLPFLALVGFLFLRSVKTQKPLHENVLHKETVALGSGFLDPKNRKLMFHGETVDLTRTETSILLIFASSPHVMIERNRLQKEIWEDQGVIVGRSLDMFISKLRKKLEFDPNLKIVVVRGKGYKLETSC